MTKSIAVVIPTFNGKASLRECLDSLQAQTIKHTVIVVENGSTDGSVDFVRNRYPHAQLIINPHNLGFAGGVNCGIRRALNDRFDYIALFNNDAVADPHWLERLANTMDANPQLGIVTSKITDFSGKHLDSTGECYSTWGLSFPRGRGETALNTYDQHLRIFGASGGASLYRAKMFQQIGIFDEHFFAYYEDMDISFRARLAGWEIAFVPAATCRHRIGVTSSRFKGFTTYQTMKNYPMLFYKNVPRQLLPLMWPRFTAAYVLFFASSLRRGDAWPAIRGAGRATLKLPHILRTRRYIQSHRSLDIASLRALLYYDLPPEATRLHAFRTKVRKITGRSRSGAKTKASA